MRMVNPEWEAIRDLEYEQKYCDIQFDLVGREIPADHGAALHAALCAHLPWLAGAGDVGIHPVHAAPSGRNANLVINRRVKLVLRVPLARRADVAVLCGARIDPGAGELLIGDLKEKRLTPFAYLYAHFVDMGVADEAAFLSAARAALEEMGIQCGLIPGKQRKMTSPVGEISGYSLMLHDIDLLQSLQVQEVGIGRNRGFGCGIFIPHKSIKEVAII